ncbi:ubiquitin-associated protein 1 [Patella vulgata]|uniref:ubiquitin-associated protein 1 n=1 Tax=Patella vulgata TaxID=6465 RepID=UPI00217F6C9E|nr:ubiquitin-associated protein 1 [Patella vulgata]
MADGTSLNSFEGLGSSHSCLDGVPFKLGPKFRPPEKIKIPPELLLPSTCQKLNEEYSFETEEGVLAWIRAKEETRRRQKIEAEERSAKEIEEFAQATKADSSDESESDQEFSVQSQMVVNPLTRPNFDSILTPTPIYSNSTSQSSADSATNKTSSIDLTWFEKETDAFENLDLQALNEMEELKNLFQDTEAFNVKASDNTNTSNNSVEKNEEITSSDGELKTPVAKPRTSCNGMVPNVIPHVDEGDYVSLKVDMSQSRVMFSNDKCDTSQNKPTPGVANLGGNLPSHMVNSGLYKPVLPSLSQAGLKPTLNGLNGVNQQITTLNSQTDVIYSNSPPNHTDVLSNQPLYENVRLRSAKSNPDLSESPEHVESARFSLSHTPPPIPQRSVQQAPIYENINIRKPLPPIPSSKPNPVSSSVPDSIFCTQPIPSPKPVTSVKDDICPPKSPPETDPYSALSLPDQQFVRKFGLMGFPRARVSRAVAKLGQDEKEVIDHLCHVDNLVGKGYHPIKSESALFLFENNIDKARNYIDSYSQFQELGFHADKIREALIKHNADRDKALDELMAT